MNYTVEQVVTLDGASTLVRLGASGDSELGLRLLAELAEGRSLSDALVRALAGRKPVVTP